MNKLRLVVVAKPSAIAASSQAGSPLTLTLRYTELAADRFKTNGANWGSEQ